MDDAQYWTDYAAYLRKLGPQKPSASNTLFSPNRASQEFGLVYMHAWQAVRTSPWKQYVTIIGRDTNDAPTSYMVPAVVEVGEGNMLGVGFDSAPVNGARLKLKGKHVHKSEFDFTAVHKSDLKKIPMTQRSIETAGLKIAIAHDDAAIRRLDEELIFAQVRETESQIPF